MTLGVTPSRILGDWPVGARPGRLPTPEERARAQDIFYRQTRGASDMDGSFGRRAATNVAIFALMVVGGATGAIGINWLLSFLAAHITIH